MPTSRVAAWMEEKGLKVGDFCFLLTPRMCLEQKSPLFCRLMWEDGKKIHFRFRHEHSLFTIDIYKNDLKKGLSPYVRRIRDEEVPFYQFKYGL